MDTKELKETLDHVAHLWGMRVALLEALEGTEKGTMKEQEIRWAIESDDEQLVDEIPNLIEMGLAFLGSKQEVERWNAWVKGERPDASEREGGG